MSRQSGKKLDKRGKNLKPLTDRNGVKTRRWTGRSQRDPRQANAQLGLRASGNPSRGSAQREAPPEFVYLNNRTGEKVIADFRRMIESGDMSKLTRGLYHHLTMYGGHIAHYDTNGFRAHFTGDLTRLVAKARAAGARHVPAYDDSGYKDGLSANQVNQRLAEIAEELAPAVERREQEAQDAEELRLLEGLAAKHGFRVEPAADLELPELDEDEPLDLTPDAFLSGKTSAQLAEIDRRYEEEQKGKLIEGWCVTKEYDDPGDLPSRIGWGQFTGQSSGAAYETGIEPGSIHNPLRWETFDDDGGRCYSGVISHSWTTGSEQQVFAPLEFSTLDLGAVVLKIDGETM